MPLLSWLVFLVCVLRAASNLWKLRVTQQFSFTPAHTERVAHSQISAENNRHHQPYIYFLGLTIKVALNRRINHPPFTLLFSDLKWHDPKTTCWIKGSCRNHKKKQKKQSLFPPAKYSTAGHYDCMFLRADKPFANQLANRMHFVLR